MNNLHPLARLFLDPTIQDSFNAVSIVFYMAMVITIAAIILERKAR